MNKPNLKIIDGTIYANSLDIAEKFERRHQDILKLVTRKITGVSFSNIAERDEFLSVGFVLTEYTNSRGQKFPCYNLNREAFDLVILGLTGQNALDHQLEYVFEFRRMERELRQAGQAIERIKQLGLFADDVREDEYTIAEFLEQLAIIGLFNARTTASGIKSKIKRGEIVGRFDGTRYVIPESSLKSFIKRREVSY